MDKKLQVSKNAKIFQIYSNTPNSNSIWNQCTNNDSVDVPQQIPIYFIIFIQIVVEALDEFPTNFIQSQTRVSTPKVIVQANL